MGGGDLPSRSPRGLPAAPQGPAPTVPAPLRGAAGEVRTYLSLLSTPSWIHLSTAPQSIVGKPSPGGGAGPGTGTGTGTGTRSGIGAGIRAATGISSGASAAARLQRGLRPPPTAGPSGRRWSEGAPPSWDPVFFILFLSPFSSIFLIFFAPRRPASLPPHAAARPGGSQPSGKGTRARRSAATPRPPGGAQRGSPRVLALNYNNLILISAFKLAQAAVGCPSAPRTASWLETSAWFC